MRDAVRESKPDGPNFVAENNEPLTKVNAESRYNRNPF